MTRTKVTITWRDGLHLRRATELVRLAQNFSSRICFHVGSRMADGRSVLSLLLLSAGLGTALVIEAAGADETEALRAIQDFFRDRNAGAP